MCSCWRFVRSSASRWKSFLAFSLASFSVCATRTKHKHVQPSHGGRGGSHARRPHVGQLAAQRRLLQHVWLTSAFLCKSELQCLGKFSRAVTVGTRRRPNELVGGGREDVCVNGIHYGDGLLFALIRFPGSFLFLSQFPQISDCVRWNVLSRRLLWK